MKKEYKCLNCGRDIRKKWINKGTPGTEWNSCAHYSSSVKKKEDEE